MRKVMTILAAIIMNTFFGVLIASIIGFNPIAGVIGANLLSLIPMIPAGSLGAGVLTEIWTGELIKKLRAGDVADFLDGVPDYSQYAENDVIHLVDVGGDPDVLINNTTYPIPVQELEDGDAVFGLDKFQTKATPVTDDELYASSYDKIQSVKDRHAAAIAETKYLKAIHAFAPTSNTTSTPVIATTGDNDADGVRKMLTRSDIINLKKKFDKMEVPVKGRRLVLCSDHVNDLLAIDQKFRDQYYNYTTGKIANMYGFEVFEFVNNPYYKGTGEAANTKMAIGSVPSPTDFQASVAYFVPRMFKATGTTKMYYSEAKTDPENQRNLLNYRHFFIALPKKQEAIGAIVSAQPAGE
jgi:hypothetical protein